MINGETRITGTIASESVISGSIAAEAQIQGSIPSAVMVLDDWVISMIPIEGGNRLIARKGTQIQQMDVLNGFMGVTDDGDGNVQLY